MLPVFLALQVAAADAYATPALRDLVARASQLNRAPPAALRGYNATAESELAMILRQPDASEIVGQLEQTRSQVRWDRSGEFEQRVSGYRAQSAGMNVSAVSYFRQSWLVPMLYGDRLTLLFGSVMPSDSARLERARRSTRPRAFAAHPLSQARDTLYRFTGGDTVITMRLHDRDVPIVRVMVEPQSDLARRTIGGVLLFRGEVDLDATRLHVVRMRGQLVRVGGPSSAVVGAMDLVAVAFIELVNAEVEGRYWLPLYQRVELQAAAPRMGAMRSIIRIITRFGDVALDEDASRVTIEATGSDSLVARPHRIVMARRDTLAAFNDWGRELGVEAAVTHADDFQDIGPDRWRIRGAPRLDFQVERFADLFHFSRVEGAYTGYGATLRMRDAAPGLVFRTAAGWAWAERAARGRASVELDRGARQYAMRAGRGLDVTNDFRSLFDSGPVLSALISSRDDRDYVDRRYASLSASQRFGPRRAARLRLDAAVVSDAGADAHVTRGLVRADSAFRANRGVTAGRYLRQTVALDLNPDVNGEAINRGGGAVLQIENGRGDLAYTRVDARISMRTNRGATTFASRFDAGALFSSRPPPQQLYELGGEAVLPSYDYKTFAGDRAAALRVLVMRGFPVLRAPIHLRGPWYMPAPAPALAASVRMAMVDAAEPGTAAAMLMLDSRVGPGGVRIPAVSSSNGWRSAAELSLRFFGGAFGVGMTRALDHRDSWKLRVSWAQEL